MDIYCLLEQKPQLEKLRKEYVCHFSDSIILCSIFQLPRTALVIRLLLIRDPLGPILALEHSLSYIRMQALKHLKSLILNNTQILGKNEIIKQKHTFHI